MYYMDELLARLVESDKRRKLRILLYCKSSIN